MSITLAPSPLASLPGSGWRTSRLTALGHAKMFGILCMDDAVRLRLSLAGFMPGAAGGDRNFRAGRQNGSTHPRQMASLQPDNPLRLTG
ncbi:hypothetical protein NMQ14_10120 [Methyloversatilis sp. XJ19-13]|uniref:hypothetical protein n=1 Tax=Methyloversatilis sp. XJ19-13 TaxID=2963430 RepID=UPI00211C544F|nr:hypothetical protein [Methyloversatilis sp. XJ19-13]MCQ9374604.1 hypothetical protein [Methyloversatilis sp. XJ19-13]